MENESSKDCCIPDFTSSRECESEMISERIESAGYNPMPENPRVSEKLYQDFLRDWLNMRYLSAFVIDQEPKEYEVVVTFRLMFGGTFKQTFNRPDTPSIYETSDYNYEDLLDLVNLDLNSLDELALQEIPITKTGDDWKVNMDGESNVKSELSSKKSKRFAKKQFIKSFILTPLTPLLVFIGIIWSEYRFVLLLAGILFMYILLSTLSDMAKMGD